MSSTKPTSSEHHDCPSIRFIYNRLFLEHLQNTELPADYSRPWTEAKAKAAAGSAAVAIVLGTGTEIALNSLFEIDKVGLFVGALAAGLTWDALGGVDREAPINGGYDAKLIADKPARLKTVLDYLNKQQQANIQLDDTSTSSSSSSPSSLHPRTMEMVAKVHDENYIELLRAKCASTDRPVRLSPTYSRTLVDQFSFDAALEAVSSWMKAVDNVENNRDSSVLSFCLTRPPSHHACKGKGMGGCLLNSVAIAAKYALESNKNNSNKTTKVGILDIDAHHGNGIAHCVQDEPRIQFVSLHEEFSEKNMFNSSERKEDDPRSPSADDVGPMGNICNLNLPANAGWPEYETRLKEALSKLHDCDLLLVAAGFDAMDADWSSSLRLTTDDYKKIGSLIRDAHGYRVVMGLEGGYATQEMPRALMSLVSAWR